MTAQRPDREVLGASQLKASEENGASVDVEDLYELSPMQQGILVDCLSIDDASLYVVQIVFDLEGRLDTAAFEEAWRRVVERHSILRTSFRWEGLSKPIQVVHREAAVCFEHLDWRNMAADARARELDSWLRADRSRGFSFGSAPLSRWILVRVGPRAYQFIWTFHHILFEGWSASILLEEVLELYAAQGRDSSMPPARPYRDFITWLQSRDRSEAERYWSRALAGISAPTTLGRSEQLDSWDEASDERTVVLPASMTGALEAFARRERLTLSTVIQGAWSLLLSRHSGEREVVFGTVVSGRSQGPEGVESIVGLCINTLPARVSVKPQAEIGSWLRELQRRQVEMRRYEHTSLLDIHGWSDVPRKLPLFTSIFVFENWLGGLSKRPARGDIEIRPLSCFEGGTGYPVTIGARPGVEVALSLRTEPTAVPREMADRLLAEMRTILEALGTSSNRRVGDLPVLAPEERRRLLVDWNATARSFPRDRCLHDLFEEEARRTPDAIAVECGVRSLSYRELNDRANALARRLIALGVGVEDLVALHFERSAEVVIGILGVLKAGAAWVPLDPSHPRERRQYVLEDSKAAAIVTQGRLRDDLPAGARNVVSIDDLGREPLTPPPLIRPDHLAYVINTSGSTGRPNGVEVDHRALVNFLWSMRALLGFDARDVVLAVTTPAFDIAMLELLLPLVVGARVVVLPGAVVSDGYRLREAIERSRPTLLQATPATWRMLFETGWTGARGLRVLCGGEALTADLASRLAHAGEQAWNLYGPTETTVWSTAARIDGAVQRVSIGRPIANTRVYLLDRGLQPVPLGAPGELCIAGEGLARGYRGRPELTADRFAPHPFSEEPGTRIYRTGDLACCREDGSLQFLGRLDHQVKIRGFRVETTEIEAALDRHDGVLAAAVVARQTGPGERELEAFVVRDGIRQPGAPELQAFLSRVLPAYMVPSRFAFLEALPLTPSGKVDRNALCEGRRADSAATDRETELRTPLERQIARVWSEVLGADRIGLHDNFFDLGGHSLSAMRAVLRLEKELGLRLGPADFLFQNLGQVASECAARLAAGVPSQNRGWRWRFRNA